MVAFLMVLGVTWIVLKMGDTNQQASDNFKKATANWTARKGNVLHVEEKRLT